MRRRPKNPPRPPMRPDRDRPSDRPDRSPDRISDRAERSSPVQGAKSQLSSLFNYATMAVLAAVFILGIGVGIAFSSTTNFDPGNVATREVIDRSAPNPEICVQYGASAITVDFRAFLTLNPFNVYLSQPAMQPGCVLRSSNWGVLQQRNLVTSKQTDECRRRLNTFGYTGEIDGASANPKIDCIYQNDSAKNLFLDQPGFRDTPPETNRF